MARTEKEVAIRVGAATVKPGDRIVIGGQLMRVLDLVELPRGAKRIRFYTGEVLSIHARTTLTALRVGEGW